MVKNLSAKVGDLRDMDSRPGFRRSSGVGNANPLQYSCLGNPMNRGDWCTIVHVVAESDMAKHLSIQSSLRFAFNIDFFLKCIETSSIWKVWNDQINIKTIVNYDNH